MNKVVVVSAYRTAIGVYKKTFADKDIVIMASKIVEHIMKTTKL